MRLILQGIFWTQRLTPSLLSLLHWQADSLPLRHLGNRCSTVGPCLSILHTEVSPSSIPGSGRSAGDRRPTPVFLGFPCGSAGKESACNAGDLGSIPGLGRCSGEGKGYPFQYSGLENSMDCIVHGVTKSWTRLIDFHFHFHIKVCIY